MSSTHTIAVLALWAAVGGCSLFQTHPDAYTSAPLWKGAQRSPVETETAAIPGSKVPRKLTLPGALALAADQSPSLRSSFHRVDAARARLAQACAAYLPTVEGGLTVFRTLETPTAAYASFSFPGMPTPQSRYTTYGSSLTASFLLFDGFSRTYRRLQAEAGVRESKAAHEEGRRLLVRAVGAAFHGVILAEEQSAIAREDLTFSRRMLEEARKLKRAGRGAESDVLSFQLRVTAGEMQVVDAQSSVASQRVALAELLGVAGGQLPTSVSLVRPPAVRRRAPDPNGDSLVARALLARPDLARAEFSLQRAEAGVKAALGAFWPTLAGQASAGHQRRDDPKFSRHDVTASVGLSVNWKVFAGGQRHAALRAARAEVASARAEVERLRRAVVSEVLRGVEAVQGAARTLTLSIKSQETSRRLRDLEEKAYRQGIIPRTQLDQVQKDFVVARMRLALSWVRLHMARFDLDVVAGRTVPKK